MTYTERERLIRNHLEPLARDMGLDIWGIELAGGSRQILRIFVETPADASPEAAVAGVVEVAENGEASDAALAEAGRGVGIEQCAELSRRLGLALEVDDVFPEAWTLEVSSPGFERPFFRPEQMPPYIGRELEVVLAAPLEGWSGRKKFRGVLQSVEGETVVLALDASQRAGDEPENATLPWSYVRKAHLVYVFVEPEKPGKAKKAPKDKASDTKAADAKATGKKASKKAAKATRGEEYDD